MKLASVQSRRQSIAEALIHTRQLTLDLFNQIEPALFFQQAHPDFSPIGWHFGHIAFTENYWILEHLADSAPSFPHYQRLFAADGLPKHERQNLPDIKTLKEYLQTVRAKTLDYLETAETAVICQQERLWFWLIQHESQHCETITFVRQLHRQKNFSGIDVSKVELPQVEVGINHQMSRSCHQDQEMVLVVAGEFTMGRDSAIALDNEKPAHQVYLDSYWIDRYPVTCGQYAQFILAGGYQQRQYWSQAGWQWLQKSLVKQPLYWSDDSQLLAHPVSGISYYEAEAYAKFIHKRLPTEAEWEKAATGLMADNKSNCNHSRLVGHTTSIGSYGEQSKYGCQDMLGNVWEWTASWFASYPGFTSYPYSGYSEVYFDQQHRVLRGGSWATNIAALRPSFRNWYHPEVRQIFAGFRCAKNN